jgi:hypothetical protein
MTDDTQTERMRERLLQFYTQDIEESLFAILLRRVEDPLKPRTENGGFRLNPILLLLAAVLALAAGTFLSFSFGGL